MFNLLMNCLLEKNGLEILLEQTLNYMVQLRKKDEKFESSNCTLYVLLKELFLANVKVSIERLDSVDKPHEESISKGLLEVLLKFQRLLFSRVFIISEKDVCWPARCEYISRLVFKFWY